MLLEEDPGPEAAGARIRAFIALAIDEPMRSRVSGALARLAPTMPEVRFVRAEPHVTLRFLGGCSPRSLDALRPHLKDAAAACPPSEAHLKGLGFFPPRGHPRILWLGIGIPEGIRHLQAACEAACVGAGFPAEARPFHAHLTLGRWRRPGGRPALPEVDLGVAWLKTLVLFESRLSSKRPEYAPLASYTLGGSHGGEGSDPRSTGSKNP